MIVIVGLMMTGMIGRMRGDDFLLSVMVFARWESDVGERGKEWLK